MRITFEKEIDGARVRVLGVPVVQRSRGQYFAPDVALRLAALMEYARERVAAGAVDIRLHYAYADMVL